MRYKRRIEYTDGHVSSFTEEAADPVKALDRELDFALRNNHSKREIVMVEVREE